jgi:hypothetical protein
MVNQAAAVGEAKKLAVLSVFLAGVQNLLEHGKNLSIFG